MFDYQFAVLQMVPWELSMGNLREREEEVIVRLLMNLNC